MNASLNRLRSLPSDTRVFCGHEYTAANLRFAEAVEPGNRAALEYRGEVDEVRARGEPSLPSTIGLENRVNPFLRCDNPAVIAAAEHHAGRPLAGSADVFAELRSWKDKFS